MPINIFVARSLRNVYTLYISKHMYDFCIIVQIIRNWSHNFQFNVLHLPEYDSTRKYVLLEIETINYIEIQNLNRAQEAFKNYEAMLEKMSWADRHERHFAFSNVLEYLRIWFQRILVVMTFKQKRLSSNDKREGGILIL